MLTWLCFLTSMLFSFLRLNLFISNFCTAHLLIDSLSLTFCNNQIMVRLIVSSCKTWDINYTWVSSCISQDMINEIVHFPIRSLRVFMNVIMWGYCTPGRFFDVANFITLTPLTWFHVNTCSHLLVWKYPFSLLCIEIFWKHVHVVLFNWLYAHCSSLEKLSIVLSHLSSVGAYTFRTVISHHWALSILWCPVTSVFFPP
jgi:hypothetical protein